ncbi:MAG TPA: TolC family protein [Kofleriaceae bacterium]|nr:TolC family protein [Kofleriaceae bacterium]
MMLRLSFVAGLCSLTLAGSAAAQPPSATPESPTALSFEEAVGAAERTAESVAIANADVDRADAQVTSARAGYLPTVNSSLAYQRTLASEFDDINFGPMTGGSDVKLPFGQRNNWRVNLNVTQPIFDGFRTKNAVDVAKGGVRHAELGVNSMRAQVALQVAQAYFDAVLAERQVVIGEETLRQAEQTYQETELGFKQGTRPEFDLVRAEVVRDNQRTLVVQFKVQRDVTLVSLRRLVGLPLDRQLQLTSTLDSNDLEQLLATARKAAGITSTNRIAVAQAKESVGIRESALKLAKSQYWPSLSAGTDLGFVDYDNTPFHPDWRTNWTLGVTLSLPVFDGLRREAQVRTTQAELAAAKQQLQLSSKVSNVETAQARASVEASQTQLENSIRTVKQAQRAYEIAELRFSQGASTHLEITDARVQLEQALLVQARAARDLRVARFREELLPALPLGLQLVF